MPKPTKKWKYVHYDEDVDEWEYEIGYKIIRNSETGEESYRIKMKSKKHHTLFERATHFLTHLGAEDSLERNAKIEFISAVTKEGVVLVYDAVTGEFCT